MEEKMRAEILSSMQQALLGEVYPNIRAIAVGYIEQSKTFIIRYYLDREPIDEDYESIGNVMAEFISCFHHSEFNDLKEECIFSNKPISTFDSLDAFVYVRKEKQ